MTIIRGETVSTQILLTPSGELLSSEHEEFVDLVEEECRKAFLKGREKGEKIGHQKALEENKSYIALLQTMTQKVLEHKKRLLDQLKPEVVEFSIAVCERIIRKELSNPQALARLIQTLLVSTHKAVRVVLAPDDLALLEGIDLEGVECVVDSLMRRGDCRIETTAGLLNYDISRELGDLQAKVLQR